jgi:AraC-like DNA-binding protein
MRADMQRFAIDALLADEPGRPAVRRTPTFLVQVPELGSVTAHWHDYYELGYVLGGEAEHVVNGAREWIRPGSAFLLSPIDFHQITVPAGTSLRCLNVVIAPSLVETTLTSVIPGADEWLPWVTPDLTEVSDVVRRVCAEAAGRRPGWSVVVEAELRVLLVELARRCSPATGIPDVGTLGDISPDLRAAVRFVERHFREPLTLARVAAVAHLSPHWFSEQFRLATGSSFQAFLKGRRLQFARALLSATDLSVTDVCHAAGFNNLSYFGRAYRAQFGEPPSLGRR